MKRKGVFTLALLAGLLVLLAIPAEAQLALQPRTLTALTTRTASDTSGGVVLQVERDISAAICYQRVDSLTGTASLKVYIQGSHNGTVWYDVDTLTTVTQAGSARKVISNPDPYLRAVNVITGTTRCRNSLILVGKQ